MKTYTLFKINCLVILALLGFTQISYAQENQYVLLFDGSAPISEGDYVFYADGSSSINMMDGATDFTIEAWIFINRFEDNLFILRRRNSFGLVLKGTADTDQRFHLAVHNGTSWNYFLAATANCLPSGAWTHVAAIGNSTAGTIKLYVNGAEVGSFSHTGIRADGGTDDDFFIGSDSDAVPGGYFEGYIDEVRVKNEAVDPATLQGAGGSGQYTSDANTALLFHFNEGSGNSTANEAGGTADLGTPAAGDGNEPQWRTWDSAGSGLPLPVELVSFNYKKTKSGIELTWRTASEVDNYGFEIERSTSDYTSGKTNADWEKIGFVEGAGNSNSIKDYYFFDDNPQGKIIEYRLKQIDTDGQFEYSQTINVNLGVSPDKFSLEQNYPNPFNPTTTVNFSVPEKGEASLIIYNVIGKEIRVLFDGTADTGQIYSREFDASTLPSGIYFARLNFQGKYKVIKMILTK